MKQVKVQRTKADPRLRPDVLPLDPRDPAILRAKELERGVKK